MYTVAFILYCNLARFEPVTAVSASRQGTHRACPPAVLSYVADIGGDHEGEADGEAEGDGGPQHIEVRGEQTPPTHRALPAPTRHQYPLINKILYLDGQSGSSSQ